MQSNEQEPRVEFPIGTRVLASPALLASSQHPSGPAIFEGVGIVVAEKPMMVRWPSGAVGPELAKYLEVLG